MRASLLADEFRVFELAFAELAKCICRFQVGGRRVERLYIESTWWVLPPGATWQKTRGQRQGTRRTTKASPGGSRAERRRNLAIARREGRRMEKLHAAKLLAE